MGLVLTSVLFASLRGISFTCAFVPGRTNLKVRAPLYALGCWAFVYPPLSLERAALDNPAMLRVLGALFGFVMAGLLIHRWWRLRQAVLPVFDADPDAAVQTLGLMD